MRPIANPIPSPQSQHWPEKLALSPALALTDDQIESLLHRLGLRRKASKGVWIPTQRLEHLGFCLDTVAGTFSLTPSRLRRVQASARDIICHAKTHSRLVSTAHLMSFTGLAASCHLEDLVDHRRSCKA